MSQIQIVDARPGQKLSEVFRPYLINGYSAYSIPAFKCAIDFLTTNLASFPRNIVLGEERVDHSLNLTLNLRPNQLQTGNKFWSEFWANAVEGNAYALVKRAAGTTTLFNWDYFDVQPYQIIQDIENPEDAEQWYYHRPTKRVFPAADVLHLHGFRCYQLLPLMSETLRKAAAFCRYTVNFVEKGTFIRGSINIPQGVPKERADEIQALLHSHYTGADATNNVIILTDGATLENKTLTPQQSQLYEQITYTTKEIAQFTNVPMPFLHETGDAKYNDLIQQMGEYVVRYTFRPWIENFEDEATVKLLSNDEQAQGYRVRVNPNVLLRGSTEVQEQIAIDSKKGGIRSTNEARALLGLPRDPDPASDKISTLGETTPKPSEPAANPANTTPNQPESDPKTGEKAATPADYSALKPLIDDAVRRIEGRTEKAFATVVGKKSAEDMIVWGNVLADKAATNASETLSELSTALKTITGKTLNVQKVAEQYSTEIKRKASGKEPKRLSQIVGENIND